MWTDVLLLRTRGNMNFVPEVEHQAKSNANFNYYIPSPKLSAKSKITSQDSINKLQLM